MRLQMKLICVTAKINTLKIAQAGAFWSGEKKGFRVASLVLAETVFTFNSIRARELICVARITISLTLSTTLPAKWGTLFARTHSVFEHIKTWRRRGTSGLQNSGECILLKRCLYLHRHRLSYLSRFYRNHSSGLDDPSCLLLSLSKSVSPLDVAHFAKGFLILFSLFYYSSSFFARTPRWSYFSWIDEVFWLHRFQRRKDEKNEKRRNT